MTAPQVFLHVMAAFALAGVVCRLHSMGRCTSAWRDRLTWNSWVLAHVLVGVGLVARLFHLDAPAAYLVTTGLALYFGVRWRRRAGER